MRALVAIAGLVVMVGCGKGDKGEKGGVPNKVDKASAPDKVAKHVKAFEALKDKLCACKDNACVESVKQEADSFEMDSVKELENVPSTEIEPKLDKISRAMFDCERKLDEPDPPPPDLTQ
jgi:hypothetical protein